MSKSPKRSASGSKKDNDDVLLERLSESNKIHLPRNLLLFVGLVTAFLPAYLAHSIYYLDWTHVFHVPLYIGVCCGTAYLLAHAYDQFAQTEFLKRQKHYQEVKADNDQKLLKDLRLQVAMGYAMFFVNGTFFVVCTLLQTYFFRNTNPYASFILSPLLAGGLLWLWAEKNLDLRKKRAAAQA